MLRPRFRPQIHLIEHTPPSPVGPRGDQTATFRGKTRTHCRASGVRRGQTACTPAGAAMSRRGPIRRILARGPPDICGARVSTLNGGSSTHRGQPGFRTGPVGRRPPIEDGPHAVAVWNGRRGSPLLRRPFPPLVHAGHRDPACALAGRSAAAAPPHTSLPDAVGVGLPVPLQAAPRLAPGLEFPAYCVEEGRTWDRLPVRPVGMSRPVVSTGTWLTSSR